MPVSYAVDQDLQFVEIRAEGTLTEEEIRQCCQQQLHDREIEPDSNRLIDLRDVDTLEVSSESVRRWPRIFQDMKTISAPRRMAIVASSNAVFGMARMFEITHYESVCEVRVFRDLKPAREWLELID